MNFLKFLLSNETVLTKTSDIFSLASQVVNIFNLFITYGDTFLPSPTSYDELYYEIIRVHQIFDNLYSMGESDKLVWCSLDETLLDRSKSFF